jgi:uncharacterized membrane protein YozB (DUF420 family)
VDAAGFLGTGARLGSDLNLVLQLLMGFALVMGTVFARRGFYRAHAVCQSSVMLLNLVLIAVIMLPPFARDIVPGLPRRLNQAYYLLPTLHALLGTIAQFLGLYIIIRAGTNWLPERLRFQNYKAWMRTTLALWWSVIILGIATYWTWL